MFTSLQTDSNGKHLAIYNSPQGYGTSVLSQKWDLSTGTQLLSHSPCLFQKGPWSPETAFPRLLSQLASTEAPPMRYTKGSLKGRGPFYFGSISGEVFGSNSGWTWISVQVTECHWEETATVAPSANAGPHFCSQLWQHQQQWQMTAGSFPSWHSSGAVVTPAAPARERSWIVDNNILSFAQSEW